MGAGQSTRGCSATSRRSRSASTTAPRVGCGFGALRRQFDRIGLRDLSSGYAVRSPASATCFPGTKPPTGSGPAAAESPGGRGPMASSSSHRLSFWTGSPISCRHRGSTGIGITEYSRPITSSGGPSRRWLTSFKGCRSPVAAWCLRRLHRSSPRNGSYIRSEIRISFRGNPKAKLSRVNVHPVPNRR